MSNIEAEREFGDRHYRNIIQRKSKE